MASVRKPDSGLSSTALIPHMSPVSSELEKRAERAYLDTYKAIHLGGRETLESRMVKRVATSCPTHSQEEMALRLSNYNRAVQHLSRLTDGEMMQLLSSAKHLGAKTGREIYSVAVDGVPVFIKKIRLTAIEQQHPQSTANLFHLPTHYQYGVGSMGFGAWRELAALEMTTKWVLNGECQNFPLMYHARVLQRSVTALTEKEVQDREDDIADWEGSSAIGSRHAAADTAEAEVVVFMENLPQILDRWLSIEASKGNLTTSTVARLERELNAVTAFMKSRGF